MRLLPMTYAAGVLALAGCTSPATHHVFVATDAPEAVGYAADDLVRLMTQMAGDQASVARVDGDATCTPGETHVALEGVDSSLERQAVKIVDERCDGGRLLRLSGGHLLSAQWAAYDLLRDLGVRFFHPEQTFVPEQLRWPAEDLSQEHLPSFQHRSFHAHRTHPIELSAPLDADAELMTAIQKRWVDWNVALKTSTIDGVDAEYLEDYAFVRGFPRTAGINLLNTQQGFNPVIDPDDPRPETEQIADAIERRMAPDDDGRVPEHFGLGFNPSEFTEADDVVTVERLTFVSDYLSERYPDTLQWATNHGTAAPPTEHYGVRFYDLPQFAPPALGVKVHLLMFYDLERLANVYGNRTFEHQLDWLLEQADVRRIQHYPESSWWLTFDLPVPLFLAPVTIEARQHDIDLLAPKLSPTFDSETGVYGHHLFTSGQEWGYWLIDYCFARMSWDVAPGHRECVKDFTAQLAHGETVFDALMGAERVQVDDMRDPEIVRFLVGSDDETEVAWEAGIPFHPLPDHPANVLKYDDVDVQRMESRSMPRLREIAAEYEGWAQQVEATLPDQSAQQAPWVREIVDGLRVFGLRAAHAVAVYESALELREALGRGDLIAVADAYDGVERARAITDAAREIVRAREADYRYPPELTLVGAEPDEEGAIENKTIYPYRYLSRTHRMFYWERPDDQLASLWGEGLELVKPGRRVLEQGEALEIELVADTVSDLSIDRGDGNIDEALDAYTYSSPGIYTWVLDATTSTGAIHHEDSVAVVERRVVFEKGSLSVAYPRGAAAIEGLLPGFVFGTLAGDNGDELVLATISERAETRETVRADHGSVQTRTRSGMVSGPASLSLELRDVGQVSVDGAEIVVEGEGDDVTLSITGEISTQEVVDLLVSVGGFEPDGARSMIASLLEYTPETLPETEPFVIEARGYDQR